MNCFIASGTYHSLASTHTHQIRGQKCQENDIDISFFAYSLTLESATPEIQEVHFLQTERI